MDFSEKNLIKHVESKINFSKYQNFQDVLKDNYRATRLYLELAEIDEGFARSRFHSGNILLFSAFLRRYFAFLKFLKATYDHEWRNLTLQFVQNSSYSPEVLNTCLVYYGKTLKHDIIFFSAVQKHKDLFKIL